VCLPGLEIVVCVPGLEVVVYVLGLEVVVCAPHGLEVVVYVPGLEVVVCIQSTLVVSNSLDSKLRVSRNFEKVPTVGIYKYIVFYTF